MSKKCSVCGKDIGKQFISKGGKTFCCPECVNHYYDENTSDTKDNVCEFC